MSKLSVIIPAYQRLADVMLCLNSLRQTAVTDVHFHVQDDASPDVFFPQVIPPELATVARNEKNLGFPGNCNAGARNTTSDILCFVNQDVFATPDKSPGWDAAIINAFDDPTVGIVGPRLLFPNNAVQNAGGLFDGRLQPYHRALGWTNPDVKPLLAPAFVDWTTGAVFAVRRWLWDMLGGFDEDYIKGYFEDVDFCLSAREKGLRVWYEPRATLYHEVGTSGGNPNFMRNTKLFYERWVASGKLEQLVEKQPGVVLGWW